MFPCTSRRTSREFSGTWDTHQYHKWRNFREAKVSDEATEALKHFACDACNRLKQPPARRQVAIAHAKMFNDVVSMDVNFWKLKERHSRKKNTLTVLNIVDAASGMHIAEILIRHLTLWKTFAHGFVALVRRNVSERVLIVHR